MSTEKSRSHLLLAYLGLFYAAAIWGSTFVVVKDALSGIDPIVIVAYRFLLSGGIMAIYLAMSGRSVLSRLKEGVVLGVILWLLYVPQTIGLGITTASNSGFITGLFVAFVPLFLRLIFKRKPAMLEVVASIVSLVGLWILTGGMTQMNTGDLLTLITAVAYALHLLYSERYMKSGVDPFVVSCQQFLVVGALSLIAAVVTGRPLGVESVHIGGVVVFLALFPTLSAFVIQMVAQRIVAPLMVSLIFALEPVFAAAFAWTVGGEEFVLRSGLGGVVIFAALVMSGVAAQGRRPKGH